MRSVAIAHGHSPCTCTHTQTLFQPFGFIVYHLGGEEGRDSMEPCLNLQHGASCLFPFFEFVLEHLLQLICAFHIWRRLTIVETTVVKNLFAILGKIIQCLVNICVDV